MRDASRKTAISALLNPLSSILHPRSILLLPLLLAAATFFTGITWGLPGRETDPILFGNKKPWTGAQIMQLAGNWDQGDSRGADIAMHPIPGRRSSAIVLNDTDARRAEIVRRYRLYSCQPDEMITFRSLSRMKPGRLDLDPRLYQYGGLWIYPIGGMLKIASLLHLVTLRTDLAFYLDHPDQFARFYIVARAYAAGWGLIGVLVVFAIGREWTGRLAGGIAAAAVFASLPVVINLAHEAKPHLPGTVLVLLTVYLAMRYVASGGLKWWIMAGISAGAATGMVLTGYIAFAPLGVMVLLRKDGWSNRIQIACSAGLIGILTFAITNPYLPYNLLLHREVLHSNVGNYGTFYQPKLSWDNLFFSARSIITGLSPLPALVAALGMIYGGLSRKRPGAIALLLAAPVVLVIMQFVLLAEGKTAEYARFALLPDVAIAIYAVVAIDRLPIAPRERSLAMALLVGITLFFGGAYDLNCLADNRPDSTRRLAAKAIDEDKLQHNLLVTWAEPAPYCMPAFDLFHWEIALLPAGSSQLPHDCISVRPVDYPASPSAAGSDRIITPISWANKPFEIEEHR
jgi:hypothetical protein